MNTAAMEGTRLAGLKTGSSCRARACVSTRLRRLAHGRRAQPPMVHPCRPPCSATIARRGCRVSAAGGDGASVAPKKKGNGRSYEDLPAGAKAACDKLVKSMSGLKKPFTREDYCANYDWGD